MDLKIEKARDLGSFEKVDSRHIKDLADNQEGKITVGWSTYRARVTPSGVSISPSGFFAKIRSLFSSNRENKLQRLLSDRLDIQKDAAKVLADSHALKQAAMAAQFDRIEIRQTGTLSENEIRDMRDQAAYGFESGGAQIRKRITSDPGNWNMATMQTIDKVNREAGITYTNVPSNPPGIKFVIDSLMVNTERGSGLLADGEQSLARRQVYPDNPLATKWRAFVADRIAAGQELNLLSRLGKFRAAMNGAENGVSPSRLMSVYAHGFEGEVRNALLKNSKNLVQELQSMNRDQREARLNGLVSDVKNLLDQPDLKGRAAFLKKLADTSPTNAQILVGALQTHLFRQTSKLGLEFFAGEGMGVKFWMQTPDPGNPTIVDSAIFASEQQRQERQSNGYNEAITFSEMRHAMRLLGSNPTANLQFLTFSQAKPAV